MKYTAFNFIILVWTLIHSFLCFAKRVLRKAYLKYLHKIYLKGKQYMLSLIHKVGKEGESQFSV